jgi:trehalose/maltose hydrolase-like predicted phosphorylase
MDAIGTGSTIIGHQLQLALTAQTPVTVEKVAAVATSRDRAISTPAEAACFHLQQAGDFSELLLAHERAWMQLWDDFAVTVTAASPTGLALNRHTFHVLQATAWASTDLDAGIAARGLHGEGYRGHVFWDEAFVYPLLTLRRPQLTRDLLAYRYRRLDAARAAARAAGLPGAMFPWQSGSDGRDETPTQLFNLISGAWLADNSHRQRHVGLAIACSVIQYQQATGDMPFLAPDTARTRRSWRSPDHLRLWLEHLEAEHHAALDVFGDVAVSHPAPGAADIEQDVDNLTGPNQNGVLPDEVGFGHTAPVEHQETTRAVNMERMLHLMVRSS